MPDITSYLPVRSSGVIISTLNSTTTPLGAGGIFTGTSESITLYNEIDINIAGSPSGASGTLTFEFSPDGTNWDVSVPITVTGLSNQVPQFLRVILPYFRVRYTNGSTPQTTFRLTVTYHYFTAMRLTRFLNQQITEAEPVENVRAFLGGIRPDDTFGNVPVNTDNYLLTQDTFEPKHLDPFDRVRISSRSVSFESKFIYDKQTLFWTESLTGAGSATFIANESVVRLSTGGTTSGDKAIRQTKMYVPYYSARGQLIYMSMLMGAIKSNVRQRAGYFDANNGIFLEQNGSELRLVRRTNVTGTPVDNVVSQSAWNLDPLNGTGFSGLILDTSKVQVLAIDLQWLGVGKVRIGFFLDGALVYCHEFINSNSIANVYMSTGSLPVRFEVENTGVAASTTTLDQICCGVFTEGSNEIVGLDASASNGATARSIGAGASLPLIAIRLKSSHNRGVLSPLNYSVLTTSNISGFLVQIIVGVALTGGSWSSASNAVEVNTTATAFSGGQVIKSSYVEVSYTGSIVSEDTIRSGLTANADFAGTTDIVIVNVTNNGALPGNFLASIDWKEIV